MKCECGGELWLVEYPLTDKYHHDGVSEEICKKCQRRFGRWCGQELTNGQVEPPNCDGNYHPRVFFISEEEQQPCKCKKVKGMVVFCDLHNGKLPEPPQVKFNEYSDK